MNKIYFPSIQENLFSNETENNYKSQLKNSGYKNTSQINFSLNETSNQTYLKISSNQTKIKPQKNGASICLDYSQKKERKKNELKHNYTQHIILHTVKHRKKILEDEKAINKNKSEIIIKENDYKNNFNKENINNDNRNILDNNNNNININININNKMRNDNFVFNRNNVIRVIISSEKIIKNFPTEYIQEMVIDICNQLLNDEITYEKIKLNNYININNNAETNSFLFQERQNFLEFRKFYFNFLVQITLNTPISESTLFLSFAIFDRFLSSTFINSDEFLLTIVTSLVLAIKYNESSEANLDELCDICQKKFNKEDINKCEINIMRKLDYNLSLPTIFDLFQFIKVIKYLNEKEYYFGLFVIEMFIIDGGNLRYNALFIIEAVYKLIIETSGKTCKKLILYDYLMNSGINIIKYEENVNNCLLDIKNDCLNVKNNDFSVLINKFASDKYQKISIDFQLL